MTGPGSGPAPFAPVVRLMALMAALMVLVQIHRSAGAVLASELAASHGLDPTEIAGIVGALFLASAVAQLPTGLAFDRFGPRRTLAALGFVAVLGIAVFATATGSGQLALGRFLIGLGHGGVIAGIYLLAIAWVPADRVATTTATVVAVSGGLGGVLATTPLVLALDGFGHRATFLAVAVLTGAVTLLVYLRVRDGPAATGSPQARARETFSQSVRGLWEVARDRRLRPLFVMATCFTAPFMTVGGLWAGPYLRDVHGLDKAEQSFVLMAMVAAFHAGMLAYGPLDRLFNTRKWVVFCGGACLAASCAALALLRAPGFTMAVTLLVAVAVFAPFYSVLAAHCRGFVSIARAGRAIACVNLAGLLTVFVVQSATGWLVERASAAGGAGAEAGYRHAFGAVALLLAAALAFYLRAEDAPPRAGPG